MRHLCVLALLSLASCASPDKSWVWDNGDPNMVDGLCCQRGGAVPVCDIVDDFHTDQMWTIWGAYWVTVDDTTFDWAEVADWIIYEYTASGPGDPAIELWDIPSEREYLGEAWDRPMYGYWIDLINYGMEFDLPAGDYYTLLRPVSYGDTGQSFWLTSDPPSGSQSEVYFRSDYFGYPDWTEGHKVFGEYYDVNFRMPIPEPGVVSLAGLLLGAAGALWLRRR